MFDDSTCRDQESQLTYIWIEAVPDGDFLDEHKLVKEAWNDKL